MPDTVLQSFTNISSFNPHKNPRDYPDVLDEEIEIQRDPGPVPRPHSPQMAESGFESRQPGVRA